MGLKSALPGKKKSGKRETDQGRSFEEKGKSEGNEEMEKVNKGMGNGNNERITKENKILNQIRRSHDSLDGRT
jgi:hypothetical protein